jgi:hypothetical protein
MWKGDYSGNWAVNENILLRCFNELGRENVGWINLVQGMAH